MFNKDAMADIVVELVESKKEEIMEQVEAKKEEIEKKVDEVADKAESAIENTANEIGKKAEAIIDKLDDNPQIAKALDILDDVVGDQLNGREISCSCFGWLFSLRIARKSQQTPPSKSEETLSTDLPAPAPSTPATEQLQSTVPPSSVSHSPQSP